MLTDSHCHLASHKFPREELPALVARAREAGVTRLNLDLAATHPEIRACLGIHPCDVHHAPDDAIETIRPHLSNPLVAAVGETGLDYYHPAPDGWDEEHFRSRQIDFLEQHFQLAASAGLNVVIHTRDRKGDASFQDALAIYRRHAERVRAVFHCFIGPPENARAVIELGGLVSFGGVTTFKNATDVLALAAALPPERFMLETDSPYLAPHPHRGQRNEPAHVGLVAARIAAAKQCNVEELATATSRTAEGFFRIAE
jgi:TatD DNase family protein